MMAFVLVVFVVLGICAPLNHAEPLQFDTTYVKEVQTTAFQRNVSFEIALIPDQKNVGFRGIRCAGPYVTATLRTDLFSATTTINDFDTAHIQPTVGGNQLTMTFEPQMFDHAGVRLYPWREPYVSVFQFVASDKAIPLPPSLFPSSKQSSSDHSVASGICVFTMQFSSPFNVNGTYQVYYTSDDSISFSAVCGVRRMTLIGNTTAASVDGKTNILIYNAFPQTTARFGYAVLYEVNGQTEIAYAFPKAWSTASACNAIPLAAPTLLKPSSPPGPQPCTNNDKDCATDKALLGGLITVTVLLTLALFGWLLTYRSLSGKKSTDYSMM